MLSVTACETAAVDAQGDLTTAGDVSQPRADAAPEPSRPDPTPWIYGPSDDPVLPSLTPNQRAQALAVALDASLELAPRAVRQVQDLLLPPPQAGEGDPTNCPLVITYDYGTTQAFFWQGECVAVDGTHFSGQGSVVLLSDSEAEGLTTNAYTYSLSGRIEAADGTYLEGAGVASEFTAVNDQVRAFGRGLDGTFRAGGPRAPADAWLTGERRPSLRVEGWVFVPTAGHSLTLSGGVSGLSGFPGGATAVSFSGLTLRSLLGGATCATEPGGAASVRGPDGNWFDAVFDGPVDAAPETPADLCDTCGSTWFRGAPVEPTCLDTSAYLEWSGDTPW